MRDKIQIKKKVIWSLSATIMIIFISLLLNSCSPSNAPEISAFAPIVPSLSNFSPDKNVYLECDEIETRKAKYGCYKDAAIYYLQNGGTVEQLFQFADDAPGNHHLKEHSIGIAALKVSDYDLSATAEKCIQDCPFGYFHGSAIEIGESAPLQVNEYIQFLKDGYCNNIEQNDCYHLMGHISMMDKNKPFQEAFNECNDLEDSYNHFWCAYGVIHEHFTQHGAEDLFEQCPKYADRRKTACYAIGSYWYPIKSKKKDLKDPMELCDELNKKIPVEMNHCYFGAVEALGRKGKYADAELCKILDHPFKELCIKEFGQHRHSWHPQLKS